MSDTGTEPYETSQVRRCVVLPRVHAVPRGDQLAPGVTVLPAVDRVAEPAPKHAARHARPPRSIRARRRLALLGGLAAVAVVAVAVTFSQVRSMPQPTSADAHGPAALEQVPPTPKWATSARPARKSPRAQPTRRTARPGATSHRSVKAAAPHWRTLVVQATFELRPGDCVRTNRISLGLTTAGDLVLRDEHGRVTWSSGTRAAGARAFFQADGNLVVYQGDQSLWSSRTEGHNGATLVLRADGQVTIMWGSTVLWKVGGR